MQLSFNSYENGFGSELKCPSCGGNYLHHDRVEVFERAEDEAKGLYVSVTDGKLEAGTNLTGNPSARRHGLKVHFWCEMCKAKPVLSLVQHKGNTFIDIN